MPSEYNSIQLIVIFIVCYLLYKPSDATVSKTILQGRQETGWALGVSVEETHSPKGARKFIRLGPHSFLSDYTVLCTSKMMPLDGNTLLYTIKGIISYGKFGYLMCKDFL